MSPHLGPADASRVRLASLLLDARPADRARPPHTARGVVEHFLAVQAQDAPGAAYALGLRTGQTEAHTLAALACRDIVRTWPMRGTLHLVPSRDARWMLRVMGVKALASAANRRKQLGLDEATASRGAQAIAARVAGSDAPVTRADCLAALAEAGIPPVGQVGYHVLWFTAQQGLIAGGPPQGKEQTFVNLDAWAPVQRDPSREEALALIAAAYVRGHGPVNDRELARWTGLGLGDSRAGLAAAADAGDVVAVETDAGAAWATEAALEAAAGASADDVPTWLLPGFDELMLGVSEVARPIDPAHHEAIVPGGNGVFRPTIVDRGRVVGTWERKVLARTVRLTATPLVPLDAAAMRRVEDATRAYAGYLDAVIDARWAEG